MTHLAMHLNWHGGHEDYLRGIPCFLICAWAYVCVCVAGQARAHVDLPSFGGWCRFGHPWSWPIPYQSVHGRSDEAHIMLPA